MHPPRAAECHDEAAHAVLHAGDPHGPLAEVDLMLLAWARFKAHGGPRGRPQRLLQRRHRPLHPPERHGELMLAEQLSAHESGIAVMRMEAGRQQRLQRVQDAHACQGRGRMPIVLDHILLHRVLRAAQLAGNAFDTPSTCVELQHSGDVIGGTQGQPLRGLGTGKCWRQKGNEGTFG